MAGQGVGLFAALKEAADSNDPSLKRAALPILLDPCETERLRGAASTLSAGQTIGRWRPRGALASLDPSAWPFGLRPPPRNDGGNVAVVIALAQDFAQSTAPSLPRQRYIWPEQAMRTRCSCHRSCASSV